MVGPFKIARGGMTHLLVAVDKFTKWIEAKPMKKLNGPTAVTFIAEITTRYGVPHNIITDMARISPREHWHVSARRRASGWT